MSLVPALLVSLGAALGSILRYEVGRAISTRAKGDFPWGTWWINLVGTFLLGVFFRELESARHIFDWWMLLGTGMCGGFTTFSTMSVEARQLMRARRGLGVMYLGSSLVLGFVVAYGTQFI